MVNKIEILKQNLTKYPSLAPCELQRLSEEFLIEYVYNSNAINGNTLTLQETALVLKEGIVIAEKTMREHIEVVGHRDAFQYTMALGQQKSPISSDLIKAIHKLLLLDNIKHRGQYRNAATAILGVKYKVPGYQLVHQLINQLVEEYNKDINSKDIIESIALFHLKFVAIHPFVDANKRAARLILNLQLMQAGYPPINIRYQDREKYYSCLDQYRLNNNPGPMIDMIVEHIESELKKIEYILKIANDYNKDTYTNN